MFVLDGVVKAICESPSSWSAHILRTGWANDCPHRAERMLGKSTLLRLLIGLVEPDAGNNYIRWHTGRPKHVPLDPTAHGVM